MGKASRRKRERRLHTDRPRWAGAPGFDRAYRIAERYAEVYPMVAEAVATPARPFPGTIEAARTLGRDEIDAQIKRGQAMSSVLSFQGDLLERKLATLCAAAGKPVNRKAPPDNDPTVLPGHEHSDPAEFLSYAKALAALADGNMQHMREATPIVFDPLGVPNPSPEALVGLGLPFPVIVADFLSTTGMSLPVQTFSGTADWWVGLVAATVSQGEEGGPVDVWPTVTTLHARDEDAKQVPRELMFGMVRFGAPLPSAPEGLQHVKLDDCEAWVVDMDDADPWTMLWLRAPALAAISALRLLDAVNVDLVDMPLARAARRRAERENAKPALMVDVRTSHVPSGSDATGNIGTIEWRQRWTVRGHWKHFGEGTAVARRHPSRVLDVPGRGRCVKVWCPPHVKGPADKPLILKTRVVAVEPERMPQPSP